MKELNPIKLARMRSGYTQTELAEMVGVSTAAVSQWETGRGHPNVKRLRRIAKVLNSTVDKLLVNEEGA